MAKYTIEIVAAFADKPANEVISTSLGFFEPLSNNTVLFMFAPENSIKNGIFTRRKAAEFTAEKINNRAAFNGFGTHVRAFVKKI